MDEREILFFVHTIIDYAIISPQFLESQKWSNDLTVRTALNGKPYAGNADMRFDEAEACDVHDGEGEYSPRFEAMDRFARRCGE